MPDEHGWLIDEEASSEREVREFLAALVSVLKPELVVETGAYLGRATTAMAEALIQNGRGRIVSCETDPQLARRHYIGLPAEIRCCRGVDLPELREADLVFLDSDYAWRRAEYDLVKPGAMVVVHDTRISFDSEVPPHETWVRELGGILFDTYRGFGLIRKK